MEVKTEGGINLIAKRSVSSGHREHESDAAEKAETRPRSAAGSVPEEV